MKKHTKFKIFSIFFAVMLMTPLFISAGEKIDINKASLEELTSLPGIGPKIAAQIINHRESVGHFQKTEEIQIIKGIGANRFEKLKDMITVGTIENKAPEAINKNFDDKKSAE